MLLAPPAFSADAPAPSAAIVEQPRPFGHAVGDILTQRVLLQRAGRAFEPAALPTPSRVGAWFERRAARVERATDGARWLVVDYQLVNAPQGLRTVALPAWQLPARDAGPALVVDAWLLSVTPLTPRRAFGEGGLEDLRPDRAAPMPDTARWRDQAVACGAAALVTALAWSAWLHRRNRRDAVARPFARAWRELRALEGDEPAAWQALHRAFDATAGRVLHVAALPVLFERAPHLAAMRPQIERFYAESQALFFGATDAPRTVSPHALCRGLKQLEQRHAT
jgi:mxaA protein